MTTGRPLAALDVGSNTVRMLVAELRDGRLQQLEDSSEFVRLGMGVDSAGRLQPDRIETAITSIRTLAQRAQRHGVRDVVAVATSAVRDAANHEEFVSRVRQEAGVDLKVLSGDDEARLTALGALSGIEVPGEAVVCDLGGGSAELIAVSDGTVRWGTSVQLGSGRLTERFIRSDPPTGDQVNAVEDCVNRVLATLPPAHPELAVLTGGTATHVAWLADAQGEIVHLNVETLARVRDTVNSVPNAGIVAQYGVKPERAQVLPAGVTALTSIVAYYDVLDVVVTRHGIREGVLLDALERVNG